MRSAPSPRPDSRPLKQVLLFGGGVLLPALVLLFFTIRMSSQDRELRQRRAEENRVQKAAEIGRHMAERLGKTEQALLRQLADDPALIRSLPPTSSDLVFMGRIREGELQMPWEDATKPALSPQEERSRELVLEAQKAELSLNDLRRASGLLNRALSLETSASEKCFVRLQIGRVLAKSGLEEDAVHLYEEMLGRSGELADDYGIPFALYAADRLSALNGDLAPVLGRLEGLLIKEDRWLSPAALYFLRDILAGLEGISPDSLLLDKIRRLEQLAEEGLATQQKAASLEAFVAGWLSRSGSSLPGNEATLWEAHGNTPWLVSVRDGLGGDSRYLFAFHGPRALASAIEEDGLAGTFPGACTMVAGYEGAGQYPGPSFQGFRLLFEETATSAWAGSSIPFPVLSWSILVLVTGFAGFGMYLLWRDVRRELALADMKSHFAASVSHELKTPLTAIRMFAEALVMGVPSRPEAQHEYLRTIISESERLSRLLNNVLDLSKIEQGIRSYRFESVSLDEVIRAAAEAMAFPLAQKGFHLRIDMEEGLPRVRADKDALEQAVLNLLDNAMKYSGRNRELRLKLGRRDRMIGIEVTDSGVGISEEDKARIFGKFFRAPAAESQRIPGAGLGLAIVSHIAEAHGGRVEVSSRPGEGSTFSVLLPLEGP